MFELDDQDDVGSALIVWLDDEEDEESPGEIAPEGPTPMVEEQPKEVVQ